MVDFYSVLLSASASAVCCTVAFNITDIAQLTDVDLLCTSEALKY